MSDDVEKQIDRAMEAYGIYNDYSPRDAVRQAMLDLLAGKFKDEPLPEIARLPFPHRLELHHGSMGWYVDSNCFGPLDEWYGGLAGPSRPTKREAILAWNAVFGGQS